MKSMLIAAVAALAFLAPAFGEDAKPAHAATNANCCCGKPVDATVEPVSIKVGEADKKIAVCSKECHEAVSKMEPKEAWKAVEAHNKANPQVK
jgi:hypothetical protein